MAKLLAMSVRASEIFKFEQMFHIQVIIHILKVTVLFSRTLEPSLICFFFQNFPEFSHFTSPLFSKVLIKPLAT